jgi:hypothetical protein
LQVPVMKIPFDPGLHPTPDVWPHEAESADVAPARPPAESHAIRSSPIESCTGQDSAETLLQLNVWSDASATSRRLATSPATPLPRSEERSGAVQALAQYIFEPLS